MAGMFRNGIVLLIPVLLKYAQFDYECTRETLVWTTGPFS